MNYASPREVHHVKSKIMRLPFYAILHNLVLLLI